MRGMFASPLARRRHPFAIDESGALDGSAIRPGFGPAAPAMPVDKDGLGRVPPPPGQPAVGRKPEPGLDLREVRSPQGMFAPASPRTQMLPDFAGPVNDALAAIQQPGDEQGHKGMFPGKDWKTVVGKILPAAINGYLAGMGNPAGLQGLQAMHQQKMLEQRQRLAEEQYKRQQQDERAWWYEQQDYQRDNPKPYRWESNDGSLMELDPMTGEARRVYKDPTPRDNWIKVTNPETGEISIINTATLGASGGANVPETLSDDEWPTEGGAGQQTPQRFPY